MSLNTPFHPSRQGYPSRAARAFLLLGVLSFMFGRLGHAAGTMFEHPALEVGPLPQGVGVGDFNMDHVPDLVVANTLSNDLSILLGLGDGRFRPEIRFPAGDGPDSVAVGDLNADGMDDVVVANLLSDDLSILVGRGDGTLVVLRRARAGNRPISVVLEDLNSDRVMDVVTANEFSDDVTVLLGRGGGDFRPPASFRAGNEPFALAVGDFNGDNAPDLAVATLFPGGVSLLMGNGDGTFRPRNRIELDYEATAVAVADVDSDGSQDLVVALFIDFNPPFTQDNLLVFLGQGDGTFRPGEPTHANDYPIFLGVGDFNADGAVDLAAVNIESDDISILLGRGDGTFASSQTVPAGNEPLPLDIADFDGDDRQDLVVANSFGDDVWVLLGEGDGTFRVNPLRFPAGGFSNSPESLASADLNQDGLLDLAVATSRYYEGDISVLLGRADGSFAPESLFKVTGGPLSIAIGDLDVDGTPDVVTATRGAIRLDGSFIRPAVSILTGVGDGTFRPEKRLEIGNYEPTGVTIADLNSDGIPDLVVTAGFVTVLLGSGGGAFGPPTVYSAGPTPQQVVVADFNNDGVEDLAVANENPPLFCPVEDTHLLGSGGGAFGPPSVFTDGPTPQENAVAEFNNDGIEDLAVDNEGPALFCPDEEPGTISMLLGHGDGTFAPQVSYEVGLRPRSLAAGDFNRDGVRDLVVANSVNRDVSVFLGVGDGSFAPQMRFKVGGAPWSVVVSDLDGDGVQDVVAANAGSNSVSALLGQGDGTFSRQALFQAGHIPVSLAVADFNSDGRPDVATANFAFMSPDITVLLNQGPPDSDDDGSADRQDSCTDVDRDGAGEPGFPANSCPLDNCPLVTNASQADLDRDGLGDACDNCPGAFNPIQEDADRDDLGDACDDCPGVVTGLTSDADDDGVDDACDNCLGISNDDQADSNRDGSGDACQPELVIQEIRQDGGENLEVAIVARDPQGDPLSGSLHVRRSLFEVTLSDVSTTFNCDLGFLPEGIPGRGIGFAWGTLFPAPIVFDLDTGLSCEDRRQDFGIALGTCDQPRTSSLRILSLFALGSTPPDFICVKRVGQQSGGLQFAVLELTRDFLRLEAREAGPPPVMMEFTTGLPRRVDISALQPGLTYRLAITLTDGSTAPLSAEAEFLYQGERTLLIGSRPEAKISAQALVECNRTGGAEVVLDGSGSVDPDPDGGLVTYEWLREPGTPAEQLLGTGPVITAFLPLGQNSVLLRVLDQDGMSGTASVVITVADTQPPILACPAASLAECAGPDGATVSLSATAADVCSAEVAVANSRTEGGADASGTYPLGMTDVTFTATDALGNLATCSTSMTVRDTIPPALDLGIDPPVLWPPDHRMVSVNLRLQATDACDPGVQPILASVVSNEPDDALGIGDGETSDDIGDADIATSDTRLSLRAERSGAGRGRTYTLVYEATDASGNSTKSSGAVTVPRALGESPEAFLGRLERTGEAGTGSREGSP